MRKSGILGMIGLGLTLGAAHAQGLGSEFRGTDNPAEIPRGVLSMDLTPSENMRGLPRLEQADLEALVERGQTRQTLSAEELAEKFGTVSRNRSGTIETRPAGEGFFGASVPDTPLIERRTGETAPETTALLNEEFQPRSFTPMNARRVADGTVWPYRAVGLIVAFDSFGLIVGTCSGALIGPRTVLSAAHCFYFDDTGWIDDMVFLPGVTDLDTEGPPFGAFGYEDILIASAYITEYDGTVMSNVPYDIAVVHLEEDIGNYLGWLPVQMFDGTLPGYMSNLVGYPGDMRFGTMWWHGCPVSFANQPPKFTVRPCVTAGGTSGGPMYDHYPGDDSRYILNINVAGSDTDSVALTIDEEHYRWLSALWK